MHESACWAVAVERWARRAPTRRRKGLFHPFVRYLIHLDLEPALWEVQERPDVEVDAAGDRRERED